MSDYKVSVIIAIYNMQEYIKECLDSVINQKLKEIEILCIDDCSTDNSANIIKDFGKKDKRVKYIKMDKNSGPAITRNKAIDKAKGEFISVMDPDDYYYDNMVLEKLYLSAKENSVNIVAGNILLFDVINNTKDKFINGAYFPKTKFYSFKNEYFSCLGYQGFLFNTNFLRKNNLYFPDYQRREDPTFFLKTMLLNDVFFAINSYVYVYRLFHKKVNWDNRKKIDYIKGCQENLKILTKENLPNQFMAEFEDFKYHILQENLFQIDSDTISYIEDAKKSISYDLLKIGILSKVQKHELEYSEKILLKLKNYPNKKIIIYGFGNIGILIYEKLKDKYTIHQIVDKTLVNIKVENLIISNKIDKNVNDCIVILTVLNEKAREEISKKLYIVGFLENQIL